MIDDRVQLVVNGRPFGCPLLWNGVGATTSPPADGVRKIHADRLRKIHVDRLRKIHVDRLRKIHVDRLRKIHADYVKSMLNSNEPYVPG
jgi:hypothetical protein